MIRYWFTILIIFCSVFASFSQIDTDLIEKLYKDAKQSNQNSQDNIIKISKWIKVLNELPKEHVYYIESCRNIASIYAQEHLYAEAIEHYVRCVNLENEVQRKDIDLILELSNAYSHNEEPNKAIILLNKIKTYYDKEKNHIGQINTLRQMVITLQSNQDYEGSLRYRFFDKDKKNYHLRTAVQTDVVIPVNSAAVVGDKVEYELHPGHKVSFYNFQNDITVPSVDFHTTDNYSLKNDLIVTSLVNKFAITGGMAYNINFPKNDFKFGNYFEWSLSMGYLVLPKVYKNYNDVNLNLYSESKAYYFEQNEFLGTDVRNSGGFRFDTYLGIQAIFFSSLITELSYKIPVYSNEYVETQIGKRTTAMLISVRYLFFL